MARVRLTEEKIRKIVQLRQEGHSLAEIKKQMQVGHGTVFRYVQGIAISSKYYSKWKKKRGGSHKRKLQAIAEASVYAKTHIQSLSIKEKILILASLYWGEGNKKDLNFINSDHEMVNIFIHFLEDCFEIERKRIKISVRIFEDLNKDECLDFWSSVTQRKKEEIVGIEVRKGKKAGKLPFGMCRVRVEKGGEILKKIFAIKNEILAINNVPVAQTDRAQVS